MKPEYLFQPSIFIKRCIQKLLFLKNGGDKIIRTSFGVRLKSNTKDIVGKALWTFSIYDLAVSEIIYRILDEESLSIDGGANIGYMGSIMAIKARKGKIYAFEPNPNTIEYLKINTLSLNSFNNITIYQTALSNTNSSLKFFINQTNAGESRVVSSGSDYHIEVPGDRLDHLLDTNLTYRLLKLDIEGYEFEALSGASLLLGNKCIENVIFEDNSNPESKAKLLLKSYGYKIFKIKKKLLGPYIEELALNNNVEKGKYEPDNFVATIKETELKNIMQKRGWSILSR